ncbi:MAG: hypothetical protein AAF590_04060 [Pseudomonadota bacterium]
MAFSFFKERNDPARASMLARAFDYPYAQPKEPLLFHAGQAFFLPKARMIAHERLVDVEGVGLCAPVLASGSNAAVSVLKRKFGSHPVTILQGPVVLSRGSLRHSAHISKYGSIPATYVCDNYVISREHHKLLRVTLQLVPLEALPRLDASEAIGVNYERVRIEQRIKPWWLPVRLDGFWVYRSLHGPLKPDGKPVSLGPQKRVLALVAGRMNWTDSLEAFIVRMVRDDDYRKTVTQALKA